MSADNPIRTAVVGAGSFGTCLAILLAEHGHGVRLWARDAAQADAIARHRRNPRYLVEFRLPEAVRATASLEEALEDAEVVLSVVPSHAVREVWTKAGGLLDPHALVVSGSKGIEVGTGKLVSQVLEEVLPDGARERIAVVSGPSFARELAERRPTGLTVASKTEPFAIAVQSLLSSPLLRCYSSTDVLGVELGGATKNVIAIAVGIVDGLELGLNARASVITRGLAEITRLGTRLGADPLTFLGLSGLGDLVLTCTGDLSRNRRVGVALGRGRRLDEILAGLHEVAEGVRTARSARELAAAHGVPMPITDAVHAVLHEGRDPREAVHDMLGRELRSELE
jgi:glycerol-3-phosphate dehydrogenase (NAD(P)+)